MSIIYGNKMILMKWNFLLDISAKGGFFILIKMIAIVCIKSKRMEPVIQS